MYLFLNGIIFNNNYIKLFCFLNNFTFFNKLILRLNNLIKEC